MKAAVLVEPRKIEYRDVPKPEPGPEEVLVRVAYAGVCGSDMKGFKGENPFMQLPRIMGHEFSGYVVESGSDVSKSFGSDELVTVEPLSVDYGCHYCSQGEYNRCKNLQILGVHRDGAFAEYVAVDSRMVHSLKGLQEKLDGVSTEKYGVLIEPAAVGTHVVRRMDPTKGDNVYIIGAGLIGIMIAQAALDKGCNVLVSDVDESRLNKATNLVGGSIWRTLNAKGIDSVESLLEASFRAHDGFVRDEWEARNTAVRAQEGFDAVVEAVGTNHTYNLALKLARRGGKVMHVGIISDGAGIDLSEVMKKELEIIGCRVYDGKDDFPETIARGSQTAEEWLRYKLDQIVSPSLGIVPLSEIERAFEPDAAADALKVLIDPSL